MSLNQNIDYKEIFELTRRYSRLKNKSFSEQCEQKKCLKGALFAVMLAIKNISCTQQATTSLVSQELNMPKPQVSRLLNSLEAEGLIERINSKTDRREVYILLTPKGEQLLDEGKQNYIKFIDYIYESIGESDFYELIRLLKKVETAMESQNG